MKVTALTEDRVKDFRKYYGKYSPEQDESFPVTAEYSIREEEPVYLLVDDSGKIQGAAALMLYREYMEKGEARFRIFHCIEKNTEHYRALLEEILKHTRGLRSVYCFIEEKYKDARRVWDTLGFKIQRYSWVLARNTDSVQPAAFPQGFELRVVREDTDDDAWCAIINEAFENMLGHTILRTEKLQKWRNDSSYIPGGMKMLWHGDKPIGTIAMIKEDSKEGEIIFIEAVSLLNSYQGKGLGRNLLRVGIEFAQNYGSQKVMLSVNAENEKAAELYLNEGFRKDSLYICYHYHITNDNTK